MAKENETIADIIAEMRRIGLPSYDYTAGDMEADRRRFADRLEAAHKRELEAVGNAAKLREACIYALAELEHFRKCHDARLHFGDIVHVGNAKHALKTALAAPARNCDKFAITEAKKAFEVAYKDKVGFINFYKDTFAWLYADANESKAGK